MTCIACDGEGVRRRLVPHPHVPGTMVWVVSTCKYCGGKGNVTEYVLCGQDKAAQSRDENNLLPD